MNKVEFIFDGAPHYALYEVFHADGMEEYYLEFRDRSLIAEFGLEIRFKRTPDGSPRLDDNEDNRKKDLLETILVSIDQEAASE